MEGRFLGRDIVEQPTCPFCSMPIERPRELAARMPHEMPVGSCSCGAVYAFDVTGHTLGTAMIEALVFGCNGDWDLAWGLLPEEDYIEKIVQHYDLETHLIVHGGVYQGRRISGTLYFIKLHEDILEVTQEGMRKNLEKAAPALRETPPPKVHGKALSKKEVEELVKGYDIDALLEAADHDRRLLRHIQRLLYTVDPLLRYKASDLLGKVTASIATRDPGTVSKLLQGFFTSISDTAASSWGALDAIGEIIRHSPEQFAGFLPHLYPLLRDKALIPEVLRALGRIGAVRPELLRGKAFHFIPLLDDPDPEIRGYAAILLGNLGAHEARDDLTRLLGDSSSLEIYRQGTLERMTVSQLASESLQRLSKEE